MDKAKPKDKEFADAAAMLLAGDVNWFRNFWDEEIHFARAAMQVILAIAFKELAKRDLF